MAGNQGGHPCNHAGNGMQVPGIRTEQLRQRLAELVLEEHRGIFGPELWIAECVIALVGNHEQDDQEKADPLLERLQLRAGGWIHVVCHLRLYLLCLHGSRRDANENRLCPM